MPSSHSLCTAALLLLAQFAAHAQQPVPLADLSFWKGNDAKNWKVVGGVNTDLTQHDAMTANPGTGVLANLPDSKSRSTDEDGDD